MTYLVFYFSCNLHRGIQWSGIARADVVITLPKYYVNKYVAEAR